MVYDTVTTAAAPIALHELEPALLPFGQATMLPAVAYTSDDVLGWELRHLFAGSWTAWAARTRSDAAAGGNGQPAGTSSVTCRCC